MKIVAEVITHTERDSNATSHQTDATSTTLVRRLYALAFALSFLCYSPTNIYDTALYYLPQIHCPSQFQSSRSIPLRLAFGNYVYALLHSREKEAKNEKDGGRRRVQSLKKNIPNKRKGKKILSSAFFVYISIYLYICACDGLLVSLKYARLYLTQTLLLYSFLTY